jgi:hypothetical protein
MSCLAMKLTPNQSIRIFGWWDQPREHLSWEDVKSKVLSWRVLRVEHGLSADELQRLQPDKQEWIKRGQLTLTDVGDMRGFPVHPFRDLCADLGEVWSMKWPPETLITMGVTFQELRERGMTDAIMCHFGFPLSAWQRLGLRAEHVTEGMSTVFGLSCAEVRSILKDHTVDLTHPRSLQKVRP